MAWVIAAYVIIGMVVSVATESLIKKDWTGAIGGIMRFICWPYIVIMKLNETIEKEREEK